MWIRWNTCKERAECASVCFMSESIIYSVHHCSDKYDTSRLGFNLDPRCQLTPLQRRKFSDYDSEKTVPRDGVVIEAEFARGVIDLNNPGDVLWAYKKRDYAKADDRVTPTPNELWFRDQEPTREERIILHRIVYRGYYRKILAAIREMERKGERNITVVGWDNTADYAIGKNDDKSPIFMPNFVLSNRGMKNSSDTTPEERLKGEETTCEPEYLDALAHYFSEALRGVGLPHDDIRKNVEYRGGNIPIKFSSRTNPILNVKTEVRTVQFEYNTIHTNDQETLEPKPEGIDKIRQATGIAMGRTQADFVKQN